MSALIEMLHVDFVWDSSYKYMVSSLIIDRPKATTSPLHSALFTVFVPWSPGIPIPFIPDELPKAAGFLMTETPTKGYLFYNLEIYCIHVDALFVVVPAPSWSSPGFGCSGECLCETRA